MEIIVFLLLVTILILMVSLRNNMNDGMDKLRGEITKLKTYIGEIQVKPPEIQPRIEEIKLTSPPPKKPAAPIVRQAALSPEKPPAQTVDNYWESGFKREEEVAAEEKRALPFNIPPAVSNPAGPATPPRVPKPGFFDQHPDLEKFIGENLVSKIGICILVIAIGFFVKYAIDKEWIGPVARVGIGILCGGILVALAHWLRNSYRAFSSVLTGGGLAVFYFSITLAFQQFHLFGQTAAFLIMVVITAFSVALSLLYNKQEVAILALVGGFATPFMASDGGGNYIALFTYLLILNTGLLVIAYHKSWRLLNLLAFIFTIILFGSWLVTFDAIARPMGYIHGFWFAAAFYVMFFVINVAHNIRENKKFIGTDFGILLANTGLFFGAGLYCLDAAGYDAYRGLFSGLLGVFNLAASFILFRNKKADFNVLYLLIGLTLTFISVTAPIQLKGNFITLFWASEAVLLYWLFQKSRIELVRLGSIVVSIAMLLSLCMDWNNYYVIAQGQQMPVIFNKGFLTTLFAAIATYILFLLRKKDASSPTVPWLVATPSPIAYLAVSVILLYLTGALELYQQFADYNSRLLYLLLYSYAFVIGLVFILPEKINGLATGLLKAFLLGVCVAAYLVNSTGIVNIQLAFRTGPASLAMHFTAHWIGAVLVGFMLYRLTQYVKNIAGIDKSSSGVFTWLLGGTVVIYLSMECYLLINALFVKDIGNWDAMQTQFIKIGLPILWGLCSFGFMWLGMHYKFRPLRIISLVLFAITLVKLFFFDIRNIAEGGKIAAFFCLGILLLVVSFMYQRLKKILVDDGLRKETATASSNGDE
ncbi:MAG: DUF2339 domain-containing protein [Chitinophagaceae bacterium]